MTPALLDHLWQSTLFAGAAGLLTFVLRKNPARLRFRLWFAASLKFLVPFAALSVLGESLSRLFPAGVPHLVLETLPAAQRLSAPARTLAAHHYAGGVHVMPVLAGLWLTGFAAVLVLRLTRWVRLRRVMRSAQDAEIAVPVDVKVSRSLIEPGLVGIIAPVVLLPEALMPHLSRAERDAILAHELSHFSSGDNITAAIHMLIEALFWFWPPVWLIGARLIAERERACDESVMADGHDAEVYAQAILKVCRFCVQSPLACASGASGADLAKRVRQIMSGEIAAGPSPIQKAMLAAAFVLALGLPVAEGFVSAPSLVVQVQQRVAVVKLQVAARIVRAAARIQRQIAAAPVTARKVHHERIMPPRETPSREQRMVARPAAFLPSAPPAAPAEAPAPPPVPVTPPAMRGQVRDVLTALYPQGNGDPDAVTCRVPQALPGSRLPGPRICQTNRQWASLRARHEDIAPDGESIILRDGSEMHAGYAVLDCARIRISGIGIASAIGAPASVCF
jgi:beta-lactamase regulating signal transducer with metallopeptidase domain